MESDLIEPPPVEPGIVTEALILSVYGPRLTIREVAALMKIGEQSLRNLILKGESPLPTYRMGSRRFADYRDVAHYFDACREQARELKIDQDIERARVRRRRSKPKKKAAEKPPEEEVE
jgi:hypothetical protein